MVDSQLGPLIPLVVSFFSVPCQLDYSDSQVVRLGPMGLDATKG